MYPPKTGAWTFRTFIALLESTLLPYRAQHYLRALFHWRRPSDLPLRLKKGFTGQGQPANNVLHALLLTLAHARLRDTESYLVGNNSLLYATRTSFDIVLQWLQTR